MSGIDEELGFQTKSEEAAEPADTVVKFEEKKTKRKPFFVWTVGGRDYNLKLTAKYIEMLEAKYNRPVVDLIIDNETTPRLSVMLTFIQCAMVQWNHGIKYEDVQKIFDRYLADGGSITDLFKDVMIPTAVASGFFSREMAASLMKTLETAEEMM